MILIIGAQFRFGFAEIEYTDVVDQTVVTPPFDCIQIDFACNRIVPFMYKVSPCAVIHGVEVYEAD